MEGAGTGAGKPMSVAERKRRQRRRLQEAGLRPVEVWVPARYRTALRRVEQMLRRDIVPFQEAESGLQGNERLDAARLRETLTARTLEGGLRFSTRDADGSVEIVVENREAFPIRVSVDGERVLCVAYLCEERWMEPAARIGMLSALLELNVSIAPSSVGRIGDRYVLVVALAPHASVEDVVNQLVILSDNARRAVEAIAPFLG